MRYIFQYPGTQIWTGAGVPPNTLGSDGDFYVNTSNGNYYQKTSGAWGSPVGNLTGPAGGTGPQGIQGIQGNIGTTGAAGASFTVGGPFPQTFTSGTAFQPSATLPVALTVFASFTTLVSLAASVTVSISPTSGGTYTTVASSNITISLGAITIGGSLGVVLVPAGYFVKIVNAGGATSTAIVQVV